jgi:peptidoglycan/LPS O-acetylase OafA/YrhL
VLHWLSLPPAAVCVVLRFRSSRGVERQQMRWVAAGAAAAVGGLLLSLPNGLGITPDWTSAIIFPALLCPPLAVAVAVLRYRLYDLDRVVSRTLTYGLVTVLLAAGYAVVVLGLGRLLGQDSSLVVAAATLTAVAAFAPLRRRVQGLVDRRFNRRRYDATRTVEHFAARLRDQVDLDALHRELLAVVDQTVQPTRTSLWLRGVS